MKRIRYKIYLVTGAVLTVELLASDPTIGMSDMCKSMKDGDWPIWLVDKVKVCVNPAHVTHVTAEEISDSI